MGNIITRTTFKDIKNKVREFVGYDDLTAEIRSSDKRFEIRDLYRPIIYYTRHYPDLEPIFFIVLAAMMFRFGYMFRDYLDTILLFWGMGLFLVIIAVYFLKTDPSTYKTVYSLSLYEDGGEIGTFDKRAFEELGKALDARVMKSIRISRDTLSKLEGKPLSEISFEDVEGNKREIKIYENGKAEILGKKRYKTFLPSSSLFLKPTKKNRCLVYLTRGPEEEEIAYVDKETCERIRKFLREAHRKLADKVREIISAGSSRGFLGNEF